MRLEEQNGPIRDYVFWMYQRIDSPRNGLSVRSYSKLLEKLFRIPFRYNIEKDENRYGDGVSLRHAFYYETGTEVSLEGCSVLEMMVALAIRCEEDIMSDSERGDRVPLWFWDMIRSIGLIDCRDNNFMESYVTSRINGFLDRTYSRDGDGGLFTLPNCEANLRYIEIWEQMCWYLDRLIESGLA